MHYALKNIQLNILKSLSGIHRILNNLKIKTNSEEDF